MRGEMNTDTKVQDLILKIVEKLKKEYQPEKIILFGSYAYGKSDRDSDVDLLIIKDTPERPIDRRVAVSRIVSNPKRLTPVEVIVLTPEEIAEPSFQTYVSLFQKEIEALKNNTYKDRLITEKLNTQKEENEILQNKLTTLNQSISELIKVNFFLHPIKKYKKYKKLIKC